ncbi:MAG: hypothetical protein JWN07_3308 [Hyphomicrobiales bacterium]|nr:hypothetical protein [Hyphomicrobiales bacterium]
MCDYSLEMYGSRPASESERYVTTRFPSGSIGLASPGDCNTAICVQYDTPLVLENIPREVQTALGIREIEDATFVRLSHGAYRDGVRFRNGRQVSLQQLSTGVGAVVTSLLETEKLVKPRAIVA